MRAWRHCLLFLCFPCFSLVFLVFALPNWGIIPSAGGWGRGTWNPGHIYIYVCICDTYMCIHIHVRVLMYTSKCISITLTYTHHIYIYIYSYVLLLLCIAFRIFLDGLKFLVVPRQTQLLELLHNLTGEFDQILESHNNKYQTNVFLPRKTISRATYFAYLLPIGYTQ